MKQIDKTVGALDVAENMTHVRTARKQRVDGFDELTFIGEGALVGLGPETIAGSPDLDAGDVAGAVVISLVRAGEIDQVATPVRCAIALLCRRLHG